MTFYNERLQELSEKIARKDRLTRMLENLERQQRQLKVKVDDLEAIKIKEQKDVDKLESRSLATFIYMFAKNKAEKLEFEKREAYEAAVKYDSAKNELQSVEEDITRYKEELNQIQNYEEEYNRLLSEKAEKIKESNLPSAEEISQTESEIMDLKKQEKELNEAITAVQNAESMAESIFQALSKADNWSTWDIFGGGLISDVMKHSHLDGAQKQIEMLQVLLRRAKNELEDVKIYSDINVKIDGFLKFADFFFDGLFADLTVKDKIEDSLIAIQDVRRQLSDTRNKLKETYEKNQRKINSREKRITELVLNSN